MSERKIRRARASVERPGLTIDEKQWAKIVTALLALVTTTLVFGITVLHWMLGNAEITAISAEASALLTLITVILYGANSATNGAVDQYIAGAWRMGKREAVGSMAADGGPFRVGAAKGVPPTRAQVARFVEHEPAP